MPQSTLEMDTDELEADPEKGYFCRGVYCLKILNEPDQFCFPCSEEYYRFIAFSEWVGKNEEFM